MKLLDESRSHLDQTRVESLWRCKGNTNEFQTFSRHAAFTTRFSAICSIKVIPYLAQALPMGTGVKYSQAYLPLQTAFQISAVPEGGSCGTTCADLFSFVIP